MKKKIKRDFTFQQTAYTLTTLHTNSLIWCLLLVVDTTVTVEIVTCHFTVGSAPDFRSTDCKFESELARIYSVQIDHEIIIAML